MSNSLAEELDDSDPRKAKYIEQRKLLGWDDTETWNLDETIAKFVLPRLKRFQELNNGIPHNFTEQSWDVVLDKIIFSMETISDENYDGWSYPPEVEEGLELFGKYFLNLWW